MTRHARAPRRGAGPFARWRRSRPFWGGLLTILAGTEVVAAPLAPLPFLVYQGIAGISGYLIGAALIVLGTLSWLHPSQRSFYGIVAVMLALASFLTSNFGGFVIGMLLGITGGALVFAWSPRRTPKRGGRAAPPDDGADERDAAAVDGGEEAVDRGAPTGDGDGHAAVHALVAVPLAASLLLAAAPADWWWPWDDWFDRGGDEQGEQETPSGTPAPDPSPSPAAPSEDEGEPEADDAEDSGDGNGEDGEAGEADAECEIRTGPTDGEVTEEEFLDAVEACERAAENGETPEVQVLRTDDRFPASPVTSGLTADSIVMSGSYFAGVVEYPTSDGADRYLRLNMHRADFDNAVLWWMDGAERISIDLPDMTMRGDVVMHITRMEVRLLGIKLVFTPDFPPPLLLPYMIVTDVDVAHPAAQSQVLTVEGIRVRPGS